MKKAKFEFVSSYLDEYGVSEMCRALGVTRQGYHQHLSRGARAHDERDGELAGAIAAVYEGSRRIYGAPKVHMALRRAGVRTSRKRVARIMRDNGMRGVTRACARGPRARSASPGGIRRVTWWSAGSRRTAPTGCGSPTSPT